MLYKTINSLVISLCIFSQTYAQDTLYSAYGASNGYGCMKDAVCETDWCDQRRSVALVLVYDENNNFKGRCTGSLITNGRRDLKPYFLTAFHNLDSDKNGVLSDSEKNALSNYVFVFNYQHAFCAMPVMPLVDDYIITGATLVSANCKEADFALLELSKRPPGNFNTFYNGWSASETEPSSGACISHPLGDVKKIALTDKIKSDKYLSCDKNSTKDEIKVWRAKWYIGGASRGSSGAPLFNQEKRVVGQLKGAEDNKQECKKSNFGRFDVSWNASANPYANLFFWLHGTHPNIISMDGDEPCKINYVFQNANDLHTSANVSHLGPVYPGDRTYNGVYECTNEITIGNNVTIQSGTNVVMNAGYRIVALPGSKSELGSNFHAYIEGCLRGCDNLVGRIDNDYYEQYEYELSDETEQKILQDETIAEIKIYPNPSTGIFTIESEETIDARQVEVYDVFGKHIQPLIFQNSNTITLNLANNSKGIYLVRIDVHKQKIVLE